MEYPHFEGNIGIMADKFIFYLPISYKTYEN